MCFFKKLTCACFTNWMFPRMSVNVCESVSVCVHACTPMYNHSLRLLLCFSTLETCVFSSFSSRLRDAWFTPLIISCFPAKSFSFPLFFFSRQIFPPFFPPEITFPGSNAGSNWSWRLATFCHNSTVYFSLPSP